MMANKAVNTFGKDKSKVAAILILFAMSAMLVLSGLFFTIYSIYTQSTFRVLNSDIPGYIFGAIVLYLGIRYFRSVFKLKNEVYKTSSKFSWSNFRKGSKK